MAQADNFMWDPDQKIYGETTDDIFGDDPYNAFEISSWSFNVNNGSDEESDGTANAKPDGARGAPAPTSGALAGKLKFSSVTIVKTVDWASNLLYKHCCYEDPVPTLILATRRASGDNFIYLQYMFREVYITQISWDGGSGTERAKETLTLNYKALGLHYSPMSPEGTPYPDREWNWNVKILKNGKGTPTLDIMAASPGVPPYAPTIPQSKKRP
jgi:type VI protein secretion system component Hcp